MKNFIHKIIFVWTRMNFQLKYLQVCAEIKKIYCTCIPDVCRVFRYTVGFFVLKNTEQVFIFFAYVWNEEFCWCFVKSALVSQLNVVGLDVYCVVACFMSVTISLQTHSKPFQTTPQITEHISRLRRHHQYNFTLDEQYVNARILSRNNSPS